MNRYDFAETLVYFLEESKVKDVTRMVTILTELEHTATRLQRFNDIMCERDYNEKEVIVKEVNQNRAIKLAIELGLAMELNQDPRGYPIKFILPSGKSNSFAGTYWDITTRKE